jgi:hypothetical protein
MRTILRGSAVMLGIVMLAWGAVAATADDGPPQAGGDHSEAAACASCHFNPEMAEVVAEWEWSEHGMSYDGGVGANTYCASCKAPLNADPAATSSDNVLIPVEEWQDITCASCHPPHDLRVEWGTPIGIYEPANAGWRPIYDSNELCLVCHSGSRHEVMFQGFGQVMYESKSVECVDCHMAEVPSVSVEGQAHKSHTWTVRDNLPFSCGVGDGNCHENKTDEWALKQIDKQKIHGKK